MCVVVFPLRSAVKIVAESVNCLRVRCSDSPGKLVRSIVTEQHTMACIFDPTNPRISAYEIHEWIHDHVQVSEQSLTMIQIDGIKRHVFMKFVNDIYIQNIVQSTNGSAEYRHVTGKYQ